MRVTNNMLVNNLVYNLNQNLKTLEKLQYQLATGKKFRVPSDDPIGASKSLKFNTDKSKLEQYERNVDDALSWMTDTEAALGEIVEVLKRAKELTVDAANGTKTTEDLHKIKEEIDQLKEHLVQIANTNYAGRHIFSGYKTDKPLITVDENTGNIVYNITLESTEVFEYNVGISERVKVNTLGGKVFGRPGEVYTGEVTQGEKPYLIEVFEELSNALSNNIPEDIQQALTNLDKSLEQVLAVRSEVGAKMNRLKLTEKKLGVQILNVKELLTYNEGVDVAEAFMNLNVAQNVYVSSLMTGARIIQPTLVEFLS
ncbi:flagellar hook-associated protein FlgL [Tepidimicrobium xylanilyticum]|uniref:flagellar hook-associated protein FlgL n=1 Tax=Tepidimicrobium xylanilyticum TaxID=1123352 RepID=UPI002653DF79|nr:flagellar hook-associated protein FlgL [Tepidimicrobium xylanilyticum]GMG95580.1 flagellar hook-associated protein FlgL [Tepidimicrobium xylanilyticum]